MGNCLRRDSAIQWVGGDHWASSPVSDPSFSRNCTIDQDDDIGELNRGEETKSIEEKGLLNGSKSASKEVKIKISKKQLVELLGKVDMKELSVEQVLAHFIKLTDDHRPWKPNLQSIPE